VPQDIQIDAECAMQAAPSRRGQLDRTRIASPNQPIKVQTTPQDFRADKSSDMIAPFTPIQTGAAENPPAAGL
jgi:hypothetical protein